MKRRAFICLAACLPVLAAELDSARLSAIPGRMKAFVDKGEIAGAVTLLLRNGQIVHQDAIGWQDIENRKPMRPDSIFQIMSMTKPFTGVAIMMLMEEGRLTLSDPVEKHLPEFREQRTRDGLKPARPVTIRDLMTHTSGMSGALPPHMAGFYSTMDRPLREVMPDFARQPLEFEPGTRWRYSNSGIAALGRIIEVLSDQPYEQFIQQRILTPLGMKDTFFFPPEGKVDRIAIVYTHRDGKLETASASILGGDPRAFRKGAKFSAPEFGLYSTAPDLAAFYQMMLNGGIHGGRRYLSKASVALMTALHTGNLESGHNPGTGFGLTWEVVKDQTGSLALLSPGTFKHGGAFGTHGWVDPAKRMVGVFLIQRTNDDKRPRDVFMQMAVSAVLD